MNNEKLILIELKIGDELYSILKEVNKFRKKADRLPVKIAL